MRGETSDERRALSRIVTLLFSLAALAERAGRAVLPVRLFVLFLLCRAEVAARDYAIGVGAASLAAPARRVSDPARLALRLRTLALTLRIFAARLARTFPGTAHRRADFTGRVTGEWPDLKEGEAILGNMLIAARLDSS